MRIVLVLLLLVSVKLKAQNPQLKHLNKKDSTLFIALKTNMARHINPNPDSALYYIKQIQKFSTEKKYSIGLVESDYLYASYYRRINKLDSAIVFFEKALQRAKKINYYRGIAVSNNGLCRTYYVLGEIEKAEKTCNACIEAASKINNATVISDTYIALGNINLRKNDLKKSLQYFLKVDSLHTLKPLRADIIAAAYQSLGTVYQELEDYNKSEEYFLKANAEFSKIPADVTFYLKTTDWHLGEVYYHKGEIAKADSLLVKSLDFFKKINDASTVAQINIYLGLTRIQQQKLEEAENFLINGYKIHKANKSYYETSLAALELGKLYLKKNASQKAIPYLTEALNNQNKFKTKNTYIRQEALLNLAEAYRMIGDYYEAYKFLEEGNRLKDSLNTIQNVAKIREIEAIYQTDKKEQEIALLKAQNELVQQKNTNQKNIFIAIGSTLLIAFLFLFLLYRNRKKTNDKLKEIDKLKSRFFANISHEFRTPLTLISVPIQKKIASNKLKEKDKQELQIIQNNIKRLLELVNQLMDLSKIEAGSLTLEFKKGNPLALISAIAESFFYLADQKDINLSLNIKNTNKEVWFDKDALEKITINLLSNALKYTPINGNVECKSYIEKNTLKLQIKNSGEGLTKKQINKIFDRFYQVNEYHEGTGIGLALVKELVDLYKGKIEVKSEKEGFTSFLVTLPLPTNISSSKKQSYSNLKSEKASNVQPYNKYQEKKPVYQDVEMPILLIVEDNTEVRNLLVDTFKDTYNVVAASDGEEGHELALKLIPDLIISDIMMPKKDGITLTKELKNDDRTCHIPIVLLTAKAGDENELEGLETGADDYVVKPFNIELLSTKVTNLIETRKQLQLRYSQEVILKPKDIAITNLDELFLEKVQKIIDNKLTDSSFTIKEFSAEVGMSRMQLHRKLKALTGLSASEFIRSQRLKLAVKLLQENHSNISEIAYAVGFNDPAYFSKSFKTVYGCSPSDYLKKPY